MIRRDRVYGRVLAQSQERHQILVDARVVCGMSVSLCVKAILWVYLQYLAASNTADASFLKRTRGTETSRLSWAFSVAVPNGFSRALASVSLDRALLPRRPRDVTLPGASHLSRGGLVSLYPGHAVPDEKHLLHPGCAKSQTKHRRRHSQQCRLGGPSIVYHQGSRPVRNQLIRQRQYSRYWSLPSCGRADAPPSRQGIAEGRVAGGI